MHLYINRQFVTGQSTKVKLQASLWLLAGLLLNTPGIGALTVQTMPSNLVQGQQAILNCTFTPPDPTAAIKWTNGDNTVIIQGAGFTDGVYGDYRGRADIVDQASLRINNTKCEDSGEYTCEITVPGPEINSTSGAHFIGTKATMPLNIQIQAKRPTNALLKWEENVEYQCQDRLNYIIQYKKMDSNSWLSADVQGSLNGNATMTHNITNLEEATYIFRLRAENHNTNDFSNFTSSVSIEIEKIAVLSGELTITNRAYSSSLEDLSSQEAQTLTSEINEGMDSLLANLPGYQGTAVQQFRGGSVIATIEVVTGASEWEQARYRLTEARQFGSLIGSFQLISVMICDIIRVVMVHQCQAVWAVIQKAFVVAGSKRKTRTGKNVVKHTGILGPLGGVVLSAVTIALAVVGPNNGSDDQGFLTIIVLAAIAAALNIGASGAGFWHRKDIENGSKRFPVVTMPVVFTVGMTSAVSGTVISVVYCVEAGTGNPGIIFGAVCIICLLVVFMWYLYEVWSNKQSCKGTQDDQMKIPRPQVSQSTEMADTATNSHHC